MSYRDTRSSALPLGESKVIVRELFSEEEVMLSYVTVTVAIVGGCRSLCVVVNVAIRSIAVWNVCVLWCIWPNSHIGLLLRRLTKDKEEEERIRLISKSLCCCFSSLCSALLFFASLPISFSPLHLFPSSLSFARFFSQFLLPALPSALLRLRESQTPLAPSTST